MSKIEEFCGNDMKHFIKFGDYWKVGKVLRSPEIQSLDSNFAEMVFQNMLENKSKLNDLNAMLSKMQDLDSDYSEQLALVKENFDEKQRMLLKLLVQCLKISNDYEIMVNKYEQNQSKMEDCSIKLDYYNKCQKRHETLMQEMGDGFRNSFKILKMFDKNKEDILSKSNKFVSNWFNWDIDELILWFDWALTSSDIDMNSIDFDIIKTNITNEKFKPKYLESIDKSDLNTFGFINDNVCDTILNGIAQLCDKHPKPKIRLKKPDKTILSDKNEKKEALETLSIKCAVMAYDGEIYEKDVIINYLRKHGKTPKSGNNIV